MSEPRAARIEDLDQLVELLGVLFAQETEFAPDAQKQRRALSRILGDASIGRIYVVREGEQVLGMCSLLYTLSTAEGGRAAWLEDFVVRPERRGRGIGRTLLAYAVAQAHAEGILRISLLTDAENERAQELYRSVGFSHSPMRAMRLRRPGTA
ncbi:MAG: N-acetyltransferase family protein [Sphingomonadaceae bacterium]